VKATYFNIYLLEAIFASISICQHAPTAVDRIE
jgi:hypothetical protein